MNTLTGEMATLKFVEGLKEQNPIEARKYKLIPNALLPYIEGMNRAQRRDWYKKNKSLIKKIQSGV